MSPEQQDVPWRGPQNVLATFNSIENYLERLKEKKEPSLGERNPLLYGPDVDNPEAIQVIKSSVSTMIARYSGLQPETSEVGMIEDQYGKVYPRLIIRFTVNELTEEQIQSIEGAVGNAYKTSVRTRTDIYGAAIKPSQYPEIEQKTASSSSRRKKTTSSKLGWYMGPDTTPVEATHQGVFVCRDLGEAGMAQYLQNKSPQEWFHANLVNPMGKPLPKKYLIEIRELNLYQTELVELAVRISHILSNGKDIQNQSLIYEIYNDLNRRGLRKNRIHGLEREIERIERVLISPLANLEASSSIGLQPESVLLVGVPGTGKTLVAEHFLRQDNGVFFVPLDPSALATELAAPEEKKWIMKRVSSVFQGTGIPVVLHIDDIEGLAEIKEIRSPLLNLMAGVRERGFYALASTNFPEKLDTQLLQPQRFGHIIYFGLPDSNVRSGILDVHATRVSRELGKVLFESEEQRTLIIKALAQHSEGFTSRFLAEICNEAKTFYLERLRNQKQTRIGLRESDLEGTFSLDDWERALKEVTARYDKNTTTKRDNEIREFAQKHYQPMGFQVYSDGRKEPSLLRKTVEALSQTRN